MFASFFKHAATNRIVSSSTQVSLNGIGKAPLCRQENLSTMCPVYSVNDLPGSDPGSDLSLTLPRIGVGESHMDFGGCCESSWDGFFGCLPTTKGGMDAQVQAHVSTAQRPPRRQHAARFAGDPVYRPGRDAGWRYRLHRLRAIRPGTGG